MGKLLNCLAPTPNEDHQTGYLFERGKRGDSMQPFVLTAHCRLPTLFSSSAFAFRCQLFRYLRFPAIDTASFKAAVKEFCHAH